MVAAVAVTVTGPFNASGNSTLSGAGTFTTEGATLVSIAGSQTFLSLTGGKHWINR